ncbi:DUF4861 domain-containing protein [Palleniella muris]|uniref:DUF4861 domain-containing protein n=1 Tax=Palleniella muris TaxID=3038145 RepID=A0AC61QS63_9BACT|nr:DUF4861 family protein [Palleniella muris]TGX83298.1 DUF4861 domain-containing protein [Palleniella muris]
MVSRKRYYTPFSVLSAAAILTLGSCSAGSTLSVHNPSSHHRYACVAEIDASALPEKFASGFEILDNDGRKVVYQLTYDNKLLIETDIRAGETKHYKLKKSTAQAFDTVCVSQIRYDFQDDFTWENDRGGYRLYGPAYRNGGGNVSGYDIWTKSVGYPVLAQRYHDHCQKGISYHKDHGSGMDAYTVGRTLGAGMNALVDNGSIAYPCAYEKCEILENGPLRTTAHITCFPEVIGTDTVVESRVVSLDKGSWMNKTTVTYSNLSTAHELVTGIVIHKQNKRGYSIGKDNRFIAYADLTDNPDNGNGVIFIGIVSPTRPDSVSVTPLNPAQGDAVAQIINHTSYAPGQSYTYYWGAGWSKGGVRGMQHWEQYLTDFYEELQVPLETKIK